MDKVYWITFYEDGKFCSRLGSPFGDMDAAKVALTAYAVSISAQGFDIKPDAGGALFTYNRYGTPCMMRIEEVE